MADQQGQQLGDRQQRQQIAEILGYDREKWQRTCHGILSRFHNVSFADLEGATSVDDLITRVADKSNLSPGYVENQVSELVGVGAGAGPSQQYGGQPQSQPSSQPAYGSSNPSGSLPTAAAGFQRMMGGGSG